MGSNTEKKPCTNQQNSYKNLSKEIRTQSWKNDKYMGGNREKSNIAIAILEKLPFLKGNKNYFAFWW